MLRGMLDQPRADELGDGGDIADDAGEGGKRVGTYGPRKAGADGIDEDEIAVGQPGVDIVDQPPVDDPPRPRALEIERGGGQAGPPVQVKVMGRTGRTEEHQSALPSLMRHSYARLSLK